MTTKPKTEPTGHPFAWMKMAFSAIQGGDDSIALLPCRVNGQPSAAICAGRSLGRGRAEVMPLFVAYTDEIDLEFIREEEEEGGGGPKQPPRDTIERQFKVTLSTMTQHSNPN